MPSAAFNRMFAPWSARVANTDPVTVAAAEGYLIPPRTIWVKTDDDADPTEVLGHYIRNVANTEWLPFPSSGGASAIGGLSDVSDTVSADASDGDVLTWDDGAGEWVSGAPAGGAPSGTAGGDLAGTYPNPTVAKIHETSGPTALTIGAIADGEYLKRSGSTLVSGTPSGGGSTPQWITDHPDAPPASPDAMDDEWDDSTGMSGSTNGLDARWSWINQGGASVSFARAGYLQLVIPSATGGDQYRQLAQTIASPTGDYQFLAKISPRLNDGSFQLGGIGLRESGTTKQEFFALCRSGGTPYQLTHRTATGNTGASTLVAGMTLHNYSEMGGPWYLQITKTSTSLVYKFSRDGVAFLTFTSRSENTFFTTRPDQVVIFGDSNGSGGPEVWSQFFRKTA